MQPTGSTLCPKCGANLAPPVAECANCLLELGFASIGSTEAEPASEKSSTARVFGDYELLDEIARGGMGIVYRARQRSLGRTVAVKLIAGGQLATREFIHRFRAEAAAAAALQHPNIVAIHEVGIHEGNHFFSMDHVEGRNLAQLVGNQPLSAEKASRYLKPIADAIHFAHEQGILHRDLKPSNVLVDAATDQPRVTDFGLAKRLDGESSLTMTGQVLGSPHFMPPEQADARRGKVSRRSDVYALGGILYFLLTARPPFQGDSLEATLGEVLHHEPVSPRALNSTVPRDLETICLKCLEKDPAKRFPSAKALAEDLDRWLQHKPILARPTGPVYRSIKSMRRNPAVATALATVVVFSATLAVILRQNAANRSLSAGSLKSFAIVLRPADPNSALLAKDWSRDLNHLFSRLSGLKTLERTQVLKWEDTRSRESVERIGTALGASAVFLGELRQVDDRARLDVELVTFPGPAHVWSHGFTQSAEDWDVVRSQVAREVMLKLGLSLTESDRSLLQRPPSKNLAALNEYYRGRRFLDITDEPSQTKAIEHFQAALRHDSEFALAHAGLAAAHINLAYAYRDPLGPLTKARASTSAALKIDAALPEAKITDGILKFFLDWDWQGAQKSLDEALRLDISAVEANPCYLHMQDVYGLRVEALRKVERAVALHPHSLTIQAELGCAAYYAGLFDKAEAYSRDSLKNEPDNFLIYWLLARTLAQKGAYDEALVLLKQGKSKAGGDWCALDGEIAYIHARKGEADPAREVIAALKARERVEYIEPYIYAVIHAGLNEADKVFEYLHQACDRRAISISSLPTEPKFAPFRNDPRYRQILVRMNLRAGDNRLAPPDSRPDGTKAKPNKSP